MEERRQALGMTWAKVASEAGITVETLRAMRRGNNEPSALSKRGLERALHWKPDSINRVLTGRDPIPLPDGGALPAPEPEAAGTATPPDDEADTAASPHIAKLLEKVNQRLEELTEEIQELRRDRQSNEEDRRRTGT